MRKNVVLGVTVEAKGEFFARGNRARKGIMDVFFVFLVLFWVTSGTVHIDESFPKVEIGIGILMAVDTNQLALMVNILRPFFWIDKQRPHLSIRRDLGHFRFAVAEQTILVRVNRQLRMGLIEQ